MTATKAAKPVVPIFRKGKIYILCGLVVLLISVLVYAALSLFGTRSNSIKVYYIGRGTYKENSTDTNSINHVNTIALQHYLKELERKNGVSYKLIKRYNGENADSALQLFQTIYEEHKQGDPYIIVDNSWGSEIARSAGFIRERNMPFIAMNGDHSNAFKNSSSVFLSNDDEIPWIMCTFLKSVTRVGAVHFVGEANFGLTNTFFQALDSMDIRILDTVLIPNAKVDTPLTDRIMRLPLWRQDDIPIILNTHGNYGKLILQRLKRINKHNLLYVPVYAIPFRELNKDTSKSEIFFLDKTNEGSTRYINEDREQFIKGEKGNLFRAENVPTFLLRCRRAVDVIERVTNDSTGSHTIAENIKKLHLVPIRKYNDAFYFQNSDSTLVLKKDYSFKVYKDKYRFFYPLQLNDQLKVIPNITFGMEIESIHNINVQTGTYALEFYYWLKIDTNFQSNKNYIAFKNLAVSSDDIILSKKIEGTPLNYSLHKVSGVCSEKLDPFYYPRDFYKLNFTAEVLESHNTVLISYDDINLLSDEEKRKQIKSEGWDINGLSHSVDNISQANKFGLNSAQEERFKSVTVYIDVKRNSAYEFLLFVIPFFLIAFIGIAMMLIKDRTFDTVGETSVGLVVGTIAYSISIAGFTPSKGNLLLIDYISSFTLCIVLLNLILCVVQSSHFFKSNRKAILTKKIGYILLALYIWGVGFTLFLYYVQW